MSRDAPLLTEDAEEEARAFDEMVWTKPQYKRVEVDKAGAALQHWNETTFAEQDWEKYLDEVTKWQTALEIINNWRSSHSYPLNTFQMNLRRGANTIDDTALIAQRIKRLSSVSHKLERFKNMRLTQMQDIGGCRAVVRTVAGVRVLSDYYTEESRIKHKLKTRDDYIKSPQRSGYRGVHLIYRYFSDNPATEIYNDLQIEMQLRSRYQHAWATTVETVGTFVKQALKSSLGADEWLRFFALMGTVIAIREKTSPVPNTPARRSELISELHSYATSLNVESRLRGYTRALQTMMMPSTKKAHYYLLKLDANNSRLTVEGYKSSEFDKASKDYLAAEQEAKGRSGADAVLVSVDSLASLERAYPNYFADTRVFVELMNQALIGRQRRIFAGKLAFPLPES